MPSYAYNNIPPPVSAYQTPSKQQQSAYQSRNGNRSQNPTYQNPSSSHQFQNHSSPNYQKPLPPIPIAYTLTQQHKSFSNHILAIYYRDSHDKYYRWSEEDIAIDLAYRCLLDGVTIGNGIDTETHAVEVCLVLVDKDVWGYSEGRVERVRELIAGAM